MDHLRAPGLDDASWEMAQELYSTHELNFGEWRKLRSPKRADIIFVCPDPNWVTPDCLFDSLRKSYLGISHGDFQHLEQPSISIVNLGRVAPPNAAESAFLEAAINYYLRSFTFCPENRSVHGLVSLLHSSPSDVIVKWDSIISDQYHTFLAGGWRIYPAEVLRYLLSSPDVRFQRHCFQHVYYVNRPDFPKVKQFVGFSLECIVDQGLAMQVVLYYGHLFIRYWGFRITNGICASTGATKSRGGKVITLYSLSDHLDYASGVDPRLFSWAYEPQFFDGKCLQAIVINNLNFYGITWGCEPPWACGMASVYRPATGKWERMPCPTPMWIDPKSMDCAYAQAHCAIKSDCITIQMEPGTEDDHIAHAGHVRDLGCKWKFDMESKCFRIEHVVVDPELKPDQDPHYYRRNLNASVLRWNCTPPHVWRTMGIRFHTYFSLRYPSCRPNPNQRFEPVTMEWISDSMSTNNRIAVLCSAYNKHMGLPYTNLIH